MAQNYVTWQARCDCGWTIGWSVKTHIEEMVKLHKKQNGCK